MARLINSVHLVLVGIAIAALLTWGIFAVLFVSPSDQGGIINAALSGENGWTENFSGNGTLVAPNSDAQYIMFIQDKVPASSVAQFYLLPNGGVAYGPVLWISPSSSASSYEVRYAIFTFSFCGATGCLFGIGPQGIERFSGPTGNISQWMDVSHYGGLENRRLLPHTSIIGIEMVGNYTLHIHNPYSVNATVHIAMGLSTVVFSRPYLYPGVTTIAIAAGLAVMTGLASWRRTRHPHPNQG